MSFEPHTSSAYAKNTHLPSSVWIFKRPCWGQINISPSPLQNALLSIEVLARYTWIANPSRKFVSPFPASVFNPSTKSILSLSNGSLNGYHANCAALTCTFGFIVRKVDSNCYKGKVQAFFTKSCARTSGLSGKGVKPWWETDGLMRYSQL